MSEQLNHNLDKDAASDLLNNVLDSCNIPQSQKSLDRIMLESSLERKPISVMKYIAFFCLLLVICSPLAFKADPNFALVTNSKSVAVTYHALYDDCFVMNITGDADYINICAKKNDGAIIFPSTLDKNTGLIIFPYNGEELNIFIPTINGECIQAVLHESK